MILVVASKAQLLLRVVGCLVVDFFHWLCCVTLRVDFKSDKYWKCGKKEIDFEYNKKNIYKQYVLKKETLNDGSGEVAAGNQKLVN